MKDKYAHNIASIAILGDERPGWRPTEFLESNSYNTQLSFRIHTVKLIDWKDRTEELLSGENPVGILVAAHLQSLFTERQFDRRKLAKFILVNNLYDRGWDDLRVRKMYRLIDWLLELPVESQWELYEEIREEDHKVPYIVSDERIAREQGLQQGRLEGTLTKYRSQLSAILLKRFGAIPQEFVNRIDTMNDPSKLESAILHAVNVARLEDFHLEAE